MDYGTYFFTNIASVTVFTVCMSLLAWHNRRLAGMSWFAGGLIVGLVKLILQGLEGKVLPVFSSMLANELYLVSFMMQLMGLHWFVVRKPMRSRWPWIALALVLATYTGLYLGKIPYSGNVINIPFVLVCGVSAWMLLRYGREQFAVVSRVAAAILCGAMIVAAYRAALTNLRYMRPWETVHAETDPRWLYSLAAMAFLATFMVMCDLWFLVTELGRELAEQARTDPLTGALNRRAMEEAALREMAGSLRYGNPLCMIMIDIDNFKHLNDSLGHAVGDLVLHAFTRQVKTMLRRQDLLARTGGDEFTILLPCTTFTAGVAAAERVRRAIEALDVPLESGPIQFTVSAGVAQFEQEQGGWEGLMQRADEAMYEAKRHGRNSVATRLLDSVT
ncbi:MAG: GGDEF domain-containing protein [Terracidiphilus sp.]|nr:GGDEF domain-containing protein [Terracidiphilus sp.]